jgi:PKD repeat protein
MKKYILHILFLLCSFGVYSQVKVTHIDKFFKICDTTDFYINGSFETYAITPNGSGRIQNLGHMYLTDTLFDYGDNKVFGRTSPGGEIHFIGATVQTIIGGDTINFNKIELNNTGDTLILDQNIWVKDTLRMIAGNIFLDSNEVMFKTTGYLSGENNANRIFGYPGSVTLERALPGGVNHPNAAGMGMDVKLDGGTTVKVIRVNDIQYGVSNESVARYYTVIPSTVDEMFVPSQFNYLDQHELNSQVESELNIYTSETNGVTWRDKNGTPNPASDFVSNPGTAKIGLNPVLNYTIVTVAEDSCDVPPYISIIADTIPLCSGSSSWVPAEYNSGMELFWSNGVVNFDSIEVTTPGIYTVNVIDDRGCYGKDSVVVVNASDPNVSFTSSISECLGVPIDFNNTSTVGLGVLEYAWDFGDITTSPNDTSTLASPTYLFSQVGSYSVTLTATSEIGCEESLTKTIFIKPYPIADFTTGNACADSVVSFLNNSSVNPAGGITYNWNFGDGNASTSINPTNAYMANGTYNVQLIANASGCRDTISMPVNINPNPVADFTFVNQCANEQFSFTNASTISTGTLSYAWSFGDGSPVSTLQDPTHVYTVAGTYDVTLVVTSSQGCQHEVTKTVTVFDIPLVNYSATNACVNSDVVFTNFSTVSSGTLNYQWDFDNGANSSLVDPINVYASAGNYDVKLIATSSNGCIDSLTQSVTVYASPNASFVKADGCEGSNFSFVNNSTIASGSLTYEWNIPLGGTSTNTNENQIYTAAGNYDIELIATSNFGCKDTIEKILVVFASPIVNINGGGATCGSSSTLWVTNPGIYFWSNGSSNDSITANFNGDYHVRVTSAQGCLGYDTVNVVLNTDVDPNLGPDVSVCDSAVLDAGYAGSTFLWNTAATNQSISVFTSGTYDVTVTDQNGCVGQDTVTVIVNNSTPFNLGPDVVDCDGNTVTLDASSGAAMYNWNTAETTQTIDVDTAGLFFAEYTNAAGCISYDTIGVSFNPIPTVNLGSDGLQYCDSVSFDVTNAGATYAWTGGLTSSDPIITATVSGTYQVTVSVGTTGCFDQDTVSLVINNSPIVNLGNDTILCSYQDIVLDAGNVGSNFLWSQGATSQTIQLSSSGTYGVTVTDANSCSQSDSINITVNPIFEIDLGPDQIICANAEVLLASGFANGTYIWTNDNGVFANTENVLVADSGKYGIQVTNSFGCVDSDTIYLSPSSLSVTAVFLAQTDVLVGDSVSFINLSYPRPYDSYWEFDDGWTATDSSLIHQYLDTGYYAVRLTVNNGVCWDSVVKHITVSNPAKDFTPEEIDADLFNEIDEVNLYPNPNDGTFKLYIKLLELGKPEIMIYNIMGQQVDQQSVILKEDTLEYNLNNLQSGVYIVRVQVRNSVKTLKFVLTH